MPVNAGAEYFVAERKYQKAKTKEEKIAALEEMIRFAPKHKGAENLLAQLRHRLAKLKKELETKKKISKSYTIEKIGCGRVCLLGVTNSGKSSLLKALTGKQVEISDKPYTTTKPEVGMMNYDDVQIQIIEIPSTFETKYLGLLHTCEIILCLIDPTQGEEQKDSLSKILEKRKLKAKILFISTKSDLAKGDVSNVTLEGIESLKRKIWESLNLIRVYPKPVGKPISKPLTLPMNSTVKDFAEKIHKDFIKRFEFARIFDNTKFSGRRVGLNYILKDRDIVEIHLK